jgi:hypothetical protein
MDAINLMALTQSVGTIKIGFFGTNARLKIRFFQKACPEVLRDRIFLAPMHG